MASPVQGRISSNMRRHRIMQDAEAEAKAVIGEKLEHMPASPYSKRSSL